MLNQHNFPESLPLNQGFLLLSSICRAKKLALDFFCLLLTFSTHTDSSLLWEHMSLFLHEVNFSFSCHVSLFDHSVMKCVRFSLAKKPVHPSQILVMRHRYATASFHIIHTAFRQTLRFTPFSCISCETVKTSHLCSWKGLIWHLGTLLIRMDQHVSLNHEHQMYSQGSWR